MHKKFMSLFLALGMVANIGVAYAADLVPPGADGAPEVLEGPQGGTGGNVGAQGTQEAQGGSSGATEGSAGVRYEEVVTYEPVVITEGVGRFNGQSFMVDGQQTFDFPGSFTINPMAGRLTGTQIPLNNTGDTNIRILSGICESNDGDSPKVVSPTKFSDWANLGIEDTLGNIAFGFLVRDQAGNELATYWFSEEGRQTSEEVYVVSPGESVTIEIIGKHGMSWPKACTLSYDCTLIFDVVPLETVKEVIQIVEIPEEVEQPQLPDDVEIPEEPETTPQEPEQAPSEPETTPQEPEQAPEDTEDPEQEDSVDQTEPEIEEAPVDDTQDNEQTPEQVPEVPRVPEVPEQDEPKDEQVPEAVEEPSTSQDITSQEQVEVTEDTKEETVVEEAPASQNVDNQSESDIEHNDIVEETVEP